jgi:hypothetical protein
VRNLTDGQIYIATPRQDAKLSFSEERRYGAGSFASKKVIMLHAMSPVVLTLSLCLLVAITTHLVMSFGQTLIHYKIAHHPMGGKIFRNHINFHHTHYSDDHLVSQTYLGDQGNTTSYFLIPVLLAGACAYLLLPFDLFIVAVAACAASFYTHVYFDKEYHSERSLLQRFAWFRRKQELHFVHHRHAICNFAVIHFFWDRVLGTYRGSDAERSRATGGLRDRSRESGVQSL